MGDNKNFLVCMVICLALVTIADCRHVRRYPAYDYDYPVVDPYNNGDDYDDYAPPRGLQSSS